MSRFALRPVVAMLAFFLLLGAVGCSPDDSSLPPPPDAMVSSLGWVETFGGGRTDVAQAFTTTADGGFVVAGEFQDEVDFGDATLETGDFGMFVTKFDAAGTPLWADAYHPDTFSSVGGVTVGLDGHIFVAGDFAGTIDFGDGEHTATSLGDPFVVELDADGAFVAAHVFPCTSYGAVNAVAVAPDGSLLVTGECVGAIDLGEGPLGADDSSVGFVARFDPAGELAFATSFGDGNWSGRTIAADADGNILLGGTINQPLDLGGGTLGEGTAKEHFSDAFVAKLAPDGAHRWSRSFGALANDHISRVRPMPDGGAIVIGDASGQVDLGGGVRDLSDATSMVLLRLDAGGAHVWDAFWFGGAPQDGAVAVAADGRLAVASFDGADFTDNGAERGLSVLTTSADGTELCSHTYPRTGERISNYNGVAGVAFGASGNLVAAGSFGGTLSWDAATTSEAAGNADLFVASVGCPETR